jgi:hypothetical protein
VLNLPTANQVVQGARSLQAATRDPIAPPEVAEVLATVLTRWRDREFAPRRATIAQIARHQGFSVPLLEESLDALLAPFTRDALAQLAARVAARREVLGFVMAGNVVGAGLHEVVLGLLAGAGLLVKTASREPWFFAELADTLAHEDLRVGGRLQVFNWSRTRADLTRVLREVIDEVIPYGDDSSIAAVGAGEVVGFGSRLSAALVGRGAARGGPAEEVARRLARDVTLFEQLGCLSPHQVFVECDREGDALGFAESLGRAMGELANRLPPPLRLELEDAAALRSVRETARWRAIAGEPVRMIEGPELSWVVVFDRDAELSPAPGLRCVRVSAVRNLAELASRLSPVRGKVEAFAVAGSSDNMPKIRDLLAGVGVSYLAEPGSMQSPPLTWRHGGGWFLDRMTVKQ